MEPTNLLNYQFWDFKSRIQLRWFLKEKWYKISLKHQEKIVHYFPLGCDLFGYLTRATSVVGFFFFFLQNCKFKKLSPTSLKKNLDLSQINHKGNSVTECDTCYVAMKYFWKHLFKNYHQLSWGDDFSELCHIH